MRRAIGPAYFIVGAFYVGLAGAPALPVAAAVRAAARTSADRSCGCSARCCCRWRCPIEFRGRVFAAELALVTLTSSISSYVTGYALDRLGWSPRTLSLALGAISAFPGVLWLIMNCALEGRAHLEAPEPTQSGRRTDGGKDGDGAERLRSAIWRLRSSALSVCDSYGFNFFHRALHELLGVVQLLEHERDVHLRLAGNRSLRQ